LKFLLQFSCSDSSSPAQASYLRIPYPSSSVRPDAHWEGYIILRKDKGQMQRLEAMRGTMTFARTEGRIALTEEVKADPSGKLSKRITRKFQPLTKQQLLEYGIPES
jgi:hypothetical protein